ncbi:hypothetical protein ACEWY4_004803 [Coilia grayii]|uniref:Ig-like domain-containing protein n=1 Tax=Coilia grayii TaxID=363190 RepID=A0ABD1KMK2_9TELE
MGGSGTKPAFESYIYNKSVKRGEDIEFSCKANVEEVEVRWSKDGQRLCSGGRISISKSGTDLKLRISSAREEDEGKYTVRISNDDDSASDSADVTVLEYDRNWRSIEWGEIVEIKHRLQDLAPRNPQAKHLRILLHGPVGAGKSSIINSINSIFQGRVMVGALACAQASTSFTTVYKTYQIRYRQNRVLPFVFNDIMGLEDTYDEGVHPDDIISAIEGHIKENYRFNTSCPLSRRDSSYNSSPALSDRVHCLVSVVSGDSISRVEDHIIEKLRNIRMHASDLGIPQVVFMTHVDITCPLVKDDLRRVYSSKRIKQKMQECSNRLGVPMNCIYPVKNYHEENMLNSDMDSLLLDALKNAVNFADDYLSSLEADPDTPSSRSPDGLRESEASESEASESSEEFCAEVQQDETDLSFDFGNLASGAFALPADREFDLEWRKMNWDIGARNRMEREMRGFRLLIPDLKHLRILLHGPVGAGKSSFINSIDSVFQGQISARALVATGAGVSFTKKVDLGLSNQWAAPSSLCWATYRYQQAPRCGLLLKDPDVHLSFLYLLIGSQLFMNIPPPASPARRFPGDTATATLATGPDTHTGHSDVGDSRPRDATRAPPAAQMSVDTSAAILSALRDLKEDSRRIQEDNRRIQEDNRRMKEDNLQLRRDMQQMYQAIAARPSASLQVPVVTPGPTSGELRGAEGGVAVAGLQSPPFTLYAAASRQGIQSCWAHTFASAVVSTTAACS